MVLDVLPDLSERIKYTFNDFPLCVHKGILKSFDKYMACHWHPDLEFILVLDGEMEYFINGEIQHLKQGSGIFVNSKRLHYNYSDSKKDCSFIVVVIHPILLGGMTLACKRYIEDKFGSSTCDFIYLSDDIPWQNEILNALSRIYDLIKNKDNDLLCLLAQAVSLSAGISKHIETTGATSVAEQSWPIIWNMINFIHRNYSEKITLEDIASAGAVCRSKCCKLFKKHTGQTPNDYLTRHRLYESGRMLRESNQSIIEIAMSCGFQNAGYFAQVFRKETGCTPRGYRMLASTGRAY